jgi:peroxiredoxin Q/BCP
MARGPQVGDQAPDFELEGTDGRFRLSEHRGERVVLLFYPGDETPVCTRQFCSYRDNADAFSELDATVVGISAQSLRSHERFQQHHDLNVPLLADVDRAVARTYGVALPGVGTRRSVFVIDPEGVVRHRHVHALGLSFLDVDDLRGALEGVPGGGRAASAPQRS